jgi:hypothetical protein
MIMNVQGISLIMTALVDKWSETGQGLMQHKSVAFPNELNENYSSFVLSSVAWMQELD